MIIFCFGVVIFVCIYKYARVKENSKVNAEDSRVVFWKLIKLDIYFFEIVGLYGVYCSGAENF